jgi:hypothetical protein
LSVGRGSEVGVVKSTPVEVVNFDSVFVTVFAIAAAKVGLLEVAGRLGEAVLVHEIMHDVDDSKQMGGRCLTVGRRCGLFTWVPVGIKFELWASVGMVSSKATNKDVSIVSLSRGPSINTIAMPAGWRSERVFGVDQNIESLKWVGFRQADSFVGCLLVVVDSFDDFACVKRINLFVRSLKHAATCSCRRHAAGSCGSRQAPP